MGGKMSKIVPGIFVGGIRNANDEEDLSLNEISHILSVYHLPAKANLNTSRKNKTIIANDNPNQNLQQFFFDASLFIHEARVNNGNCLIHCMMGVSRSVTICVAYLMAVTGLSYEETLNSVRGRRHVANPNDGFREQLAEFEKSGKVKELSKLLEERFGVWHRKEEDLAMLKLGLEDFMTPRVRQTYGEDGNVKSESFIVSHHLTKEDRELASNSASQSDNSNDADQSTSDSKSSQNNSDELS